MTDEKVQTTTSSQTDGNESLASETVANLKGIPTKEELINLLKNNLVEVTFTKLDGDERVMPCTLMESYLPPAKKDDPLTQKKVREISDKVIAVWAVESEGFRSFRYDRVKKVEVVDQKIVKSATVKEDPETKELYLEFDDELMAKVGWKVGDSIEWIDNKDGTWSLKKVDDVS